MEKTKGLSKKKKVRKSKLRRSEIFGGGSANRWPHKLSAGESAGSR